MFACLISSLLSPWLWLTLFLLLPSPVSPPLLISQKIIFLLTFFSGCSCTYGYKKLRGLFEQANLFTASILPSIWTHDNSSRSGQRMVKVISSCEQLSPGEEGT